MIVGNDYLFIQVPRTSSSSISVMLLDELGGEQPNLHHAMCDDNRPCITNRFVFGFVRNPWEREYSQWTYHTAKQNITKRPTFEEWVLWRYSDLELDPFCKEQQAIDVHRYHRTFSVQPQLGFLMDRDGDLQTNFIGRFETKEQDWAFVQNRLGIEIDEMPYYEQSMGKLPDVTYMDLYTDEMRDLVAARMMPDIEVFNYVFDQREAVERKPSLDLLTDYDFLERTSTHGYLHANHHGHY